MRRPRYTLPDLMRDAIHARGLMSDYQSRPPYQQNDYVGWITRGKREETRQRRFAHLLDDLEKSDRCMKMA